MPFICSFPFYKFNASEESLVNEIPTPWIPEGFFPPPGKEETVDSEGQGDKAGDKEYSRIEHVCNGSKVPLAYNSWKQLATGKRMLWLSWRALKATRKNDRCGLCAILDDAIGRQETVLDSNPEKIIKFVLQLRLDNGEHFVSVHPKRAPCLRVWVKGTTVYKDYFLYTSEGDPAARDIATRPPCSNLSEEGACHLSLKRISECIMNHTECQKPKPVGLPARVIDCFDPTRPRLIITNGHISSYLALSYVCGESTDTSRFTRESNIDEYTSFINPSVIPRTILDAIHLTHGLGQMYLWVDAFCIIQDSPEDRSTETARIGRIFGDAFLTIAAARSPHADAGISLDFLVPDYYEQHPKISIQYGDGRLGNVSVFTPGSLEISQEEPTDRRGWCLQERFLSHRKLVFGSTFLEYHCQHDASPVNNAIKWAPREILSSALFKLPDEAVHNTVRSWSLEDWGNFRAEWAKAISNYTHRSLSRPTDKLLAFSGVAEQFHRVWGPRSGRYVAGIWEKHLLCDLLWYREPWELTFFTGVTSHMHAKIQDPPLPRPCSTTYIAPSWSWASVDGHIRAMYPGTLASRVCEVLQCDLALRDPMQLYGEVLSARLTLRASVMPRPVILTTTNRPSAEYRIHVPTEALLERAALVPYPTSTIPVQLHRSSPFPSLGERGGTPPVLVRREDVSFKAPFIAEASSIVDAALFDYVGVLKVAFDTSERVAYHQRRFIFIQDFEGIIVTRANGGRGCYRRVGYWKMLFRGRERQALPKALWLNLDSLEKLTLDLV